MHRRLVCRPCSRPSAPLGCHSREGRERNQGESRPPRPLPYRDSRPLASAQGRSGPSRPSYRHCHCRSPPLQRPASSAYIPIRLLFMVARLRLGECSPTCGTLQVEGKPIRLVLSPPLCFGSPLALFPGSFLAPLSLSLDALLVSLLNEMVELRINLLTHVALDQVVAQGNARLSHGALLRTEETGPLLGSGRADHQRRSRNRQQSTLIAPAGDSKTGRSVVLFGVSFVFTLPAPMLARRLPTPIIRL